MAAGSAEESGGLVQFSGRHPVYLAWHSSTAPRTGEPTALPSLILTHVPSLSVPMTSEICVCVCWEMCLLEVKRSICTCEVILSVSVCHLMSGKSSLASSDLRSCALWSLQACLHLMSGCRKPLGLTTDCICKSPSFAMSFVLKEEPKRRFGRPVLSHHSWSLFTLHFSLGHRLSPVYGGPFRSLRSHSPQGPLMTHWTFCRYRSHVCLYLSLFRIFSNWYWVLTRISVSKRWTACHSKLAILTRKFDRWCVALKLRLVTQFRIHFLYLDFWLQQYILFPVWVNFPSLLSLQESSITYFSPMLGSEPKSWLSH